MKIVLFGATGMVGQGVLRECLVDDAVTSVVSVSRRASGKSHAKLREIIHADFFDFSAIEKDLAGSDGCFFCLGVSSVGMNEADYRRITWDVTMAAAKTLVKVSPALTFIYVTGEGTDSTEKGRRMWARVKGQTENALLAMPFKAAFMFRPGYIQPLHGVASGSRWIRGTYAVMAPLYPVWRRIFPSFVTTTEELGRAMIALAKNGSPSGKKIFASRDVHELLGT